MSRIYADPLDRPTCWVHDPIDGEWYQGRIHAWHRGTQGWWAVCSWDIGVGLQRYLDVPATRLRDGNGPDPNAEEPPPAG